MAIRKTTARKKVAKSKPKAAPLFDEDQLTKGQIRKLTALRKSLGDDIAERAFAEWLITNPPVQSEPEDKSAVLIAETLMPLVGKKKLRIPRGGYLVTRGKKRVIVTRVNQD